MVEQADAGEGHRYAVFVASGNDMVVAHAAAHDVQRGGANGR